MGAPGLNEFVKHFYPQIRKKALIIDVRGNGGGNVSPMLIERLRREVAMIDFARNTVPTPDPEEMIYGPMVCLADEFSASDGDLFTYRFKQYKLGKVVGKRTWGGVIGIRGTLPLLDGSYLNKPEFSRYGVDGKTGSSRARASSRTSWNNPENTPASTSSSIKRLSFSKSSKPRRNRPAAPPYPVK